MIKGNICIIYIHHTCYHTGFDLTVLNQMLHMNKTRVASQEISNKDINFLVKAASVSRKSTMLMRHGCVVVENNKIVATGYNTYRTRFKDKFVVNSCSCHAEMHALRNALKSKGSKTSKKSVVSMVSGGGSGKKNVRKRVGQRQRYEKGSV